MDMRQESHEKALKAVVEWYLERPWEEIGCLSTKSLESFAELLHTTWQQAQASMVEQMRFHKTGETTVIVIGPTPFNVETLPSGEKNT